MDVPGLLEYLKMPRKDVVEKALDITLGFTTQKDFQGTWAKTKGATAQIIALACARNNPDVSLKATKCLVNLSEDAQIRGQIRTEKGIQLCIAKLRDTVSGPQHGLYVSLLANLTIEKAACQELVEIEEGNAISSFLRTYVQSAEWKDKEKEYQHGGYVFTNVTRFDFGRKWLLSGREGTKKRYRCFCLPTYKRMNIRDAPSKEGKASGKFVYHGDEIESLEEKDGWVRHKDGWTALEWQGKRILFPSDTNFSMLTSLTDSLNPVRRIAAYQTIRNCALDQKLVSDSALLNTEMISRLLLPLVVSKCYGESDRKGMPRKVLTKNELLVKNEAKRGANKAARDLQNHDNNSAVQEDVAVKKAILETILSYARTDESRRLLDSKRTYIILREYHNLETVEELNELIVHIQNFFILDKKCLQQPRDKADDDGKVKVEHEVWSSPDGPTWNAPVDPSRAIKAASDDGKESLPKEKTEATTQ